MAETRTQDMTENNKSCSTHGSIPVEFRQYVVIDRFISQLGFQLAGIHGGGGVGGGGGGGHGFEALVRTIAETKPKVAGCGGLITW